MNPLNNNQAVIPQNFDLEAEKANLRNLLARTQGTPVTDPALSGAVSGTLLALSIEIAMDLVPVSKVAKYGARACKATIGLIGGAVAGGAVGGAESLVLNTEQDRARALHTKAIEVIEALNAIHVAKDRNLQKVTEDMANLMTRLLHLKQNFQQPAENMQLEDNPNTHISQLTNMMIKQNQEIELLANNITNNREAIVLARMSPSESNRVPNLNNAVKGLVDESERQRAQIERLSRDLLSKNNQCDTLKNENSSLKDENSSLKERCSKLGSENDDLKSMNTMLTEKLAEIANGFQEMRSQMAVDRQYSEQKIHTLQNRILKLENEWDSVNHKNYELRVKAAQLENEVNLLREANEQTFEHVELTPPSEAKIQELDQISDVSSLSETEQTLIRSNTMPTLALNKQ